MIHAKIDAVDTRRIIGFECGTRADFDKLHAGDKNWVFLDADVFAYQITSEEFFINPLQFFIDKRGLVTKIFKPKPKIDTEYLMEDGKYLIDGDGKYIKEKLSPPLTVNISDLDNILLVEDNLTIIEKN